MKINEQVAEKVSESLLQIKAIKLDNANPYTWASGMKSPIYCDNRITLSYPKIRTYIKQQFANVIRDEFENAELVAGVATGAIAQGVLVAHEMALPFAYVRSSSKAHGLTNQIEGVVQKGQNVVVIEDLISTGKSSLAAVEALRAAGCNVVGMVAIFTYNLPIATENFEKAGCKLVTLADYDTMIRIAANYKYVSESDLQSLGEWKENPQAWSKSRK